jgi:hypothetical protein
VPAPDHPEGQGGVEERRPRPFLLAEMIEAAGGPEGVMSILPAGRRAWPIEERRIVLQP